MLRLSTTALVLSGLSALLLGIALGAAGTLLLQRLVGGSLDPATPACSQAFEAFTLGERTPALRSQVRDCTREARYPRQP